MSGKKEKKDNKPEPLPPLKNVVWVGYMTIEEFNKKMREYFPDDPEYQDKEAGDV